MPPAIPFIWLIECNNHLYFHIYTPGWREAIMVKCFTYHGHTFHDSGRIGINIALIVNLF